MEICSIWYEDIIEFIGSYSRGILVYREGLGVRCFNKCVENGLGKG